MKVYTPAIKAENATAAKYKQRALRFFNMVSAERQRSNLPLLQRYTAAAEGVLICAHSAEHSNWVYLWGGEVPWNLVWRDDLSGMFNVSQNGAVTRRAVPSPDVYYGNKYWVGPAEIGTLSWYNVYSIYSRHDISFLSLPGGSESYKFPTSADTGTYLPTPAGLFVGGEKIAGVSTTIIAAAVYVFDETPKRYELRVVTPVGILAYVYDPKTKTATSSRALEILDPLGTTPIRLAEFDSTGSSVLIQDQTGVGDALFKDINPDGTIASTTPYSLLVTTENISSTTIDEYNKTTYTSTSEQVVPIYGLVGDVVTEIFSTTTRLERLHNSYNNWTGGSAGIPTTLGPQEGGVGDKKTATYVDHVDSYTITYKVMGADVHTELYTEIFKQGSSIICTGANAVPPPPYATWNYIDAESRVWQWEKSPSADYTLVAPVGWQAGSLLYTKYFVTLDVSGPVVEPPDCATYNEAGQLGWSAYYDYPLQTSTHKTNKVQIWLGTTLLSETLIPGEQFLTTSPLTPERYLTYPNVVPYNLAVYEANKLVRYPLGFYGLRDKLTTSDSAAFYADVTAWQAAGGKCMLNLNGVDLMTERPPRPAIAKYVRAYMVANALGDEMTEEIIVAALNGMNFGYLGVI